jgi:hypothetical protein
MNVGLLRNLHQVRLASFRLRSFSELTTLSHMVKIHRTSIAAATALMLSMGPIAASAGASVDAMKWQRRVIIISAGKPDEPALERQRQLITAWTGGDERDVTIVIVAGSTVSGSADDAGALRREFDLPAESFQVLLVGKDGHVALRSRAPVSGTTFAQAIDAMPMRKAGER